MRMAATYCNLAESHDRLSHRVDKRRVLNKARKEITTIEHRLRKSQDLFETETDAILERVAELKRRIEHLEAPEA
jgi:hypothetical protein